MFTTKSSRVIRVATSAVVCVTLALGTAGVALAGQGSHSRDHSSFNSRDHGHHGNVVSGVVTGPVVAGMITVTDEGVTTTYPTTGATYFVGDTAGVAADLAAGEHVQLDLTSTTPQTVTKVTIDPVHFFGTVTALGTGSFTLAGEHGTSLIVDVVSGVTTYTSGGAPSTFAAVIMNAKVSVVGLPGTTAGTLNANSVNIWAPRLKTHADGTVTGPVVAGMITVTDEGVTTTYPTTGATYFVGDTAGVAADLAAGEHVQLDLTSTTPQTVTKVTIDPVHFFGTVTALGTGSFTLAGEHGTSLIVDVVSGVTTYTSGGAPSTFAAVIMNAKVSVVGLPGTTAGTLNANSVNIWAPRLKTHADGTVTGPVVAGMITVTDEGVTTTYPTTGATYFVGDTAGVAADLAAGEHVQLDLTSTTPQTVTKVTIDPVHFFGTVTALGTGSFTLAGEHGTSLIVDVVSGVTTYTSGGAPSTFAAVIMNAKVSVVGLPGTTAGTLNANSVNIGDSSGHGHGDHGHSQGDHQGNNQGSGHGKSFGHHSHIFVSLS